jgi:hypothetical protein
MPVEARKAKNDLDIEVACWFWPLCNSTDPVWLCLHAFQQDNKADQASQLHQVFAF